MTLFDLDLLKDFVQLLHDVKLSLADLADLSTFVNARFLISSNGKGETFLDTVATGPLQTEMTGLDLPLLLAPAAH